MKKERSPHERDLLSIYANPGTTYPQASYSERESIQQIERNNGPAGGVVGLPGPYSGCQILPPCHFTATLAGPRSKFFNDRPVQAVTVMDAPHFSMRKRILRILFAYTSSVPVRPNHRFPSHASTSYRFVFHIRSHPPVVTWPGPTGPFLMILYVPRETRGHTGYYVCFPNNSHLLQKKH